MFESILSTAFFIHFGRPLHTDLRPQGCGIEPQSSKGARSVETAAQCVRDGVGVCSRVLCRAVGQRVVLLCVHGVAVCEGV